MPQLDIFTYISQYHYLILSFFSLYILIFIKTIPALHTIFIYRKKIKKVEEMGKRTYNLPIIPKEKEKGGKSVKEIIKI